MYVSSGLRPRRIYYSVGLATGTASPRSNVDVSPRPARLPHNLTSNGGRRSGARLDVNLPEVLHKHQVAARHVGLRIEHVPAVRRDIHDIVDPIFRLEDIDN